MTLLSNDDHKGQVLLEEHVRQFVSVFAFDEIAISIRSLNGEILDQNIGAQNILGYSREETRGMSPKTYISSYDHKKMDAIHESLSQGKSVLRISIDVERKDGRVLTCMVSYRPFWNARGELSGYLAIFHDVTDKQVAEKKARDLEAIIASADAGIILKDDKGTVVEWNVGARHILGYTAEEIIGLTTRDYTPVDEHPRVEELERRVLQGEHISQMEVIRKHKDGRRIHCSISFTPIFDKDNKVTGSLAVFHDITAKKHAEEQRRKTEEELRKAYSDTAVILREIPAPICLVDKQSGAILSANVAFVTMCALKTEDELLGNHIQEYMTMPDDVEENRVLAWLYQSGHFQCCLIRKDRTEVEIDVFSHTIFSHEEEAFAVYCMDLTMQKQHVRALRDAAKAAHEASQTKTTFLANMSHEIRTPLNGVIGFTELALDEGDLSPKIREYLNMIQNSAGVLMEIINNVLDISKIEAGKVELEKVPFVLEEVIRYCKDITGQKAAEKGIDLFFYAEPAAGRMLMGDPTKLRQIILNLLYNAIKFTNLGGVKVMASLGDITEHTVTMCFEVRDTGIGMTEEMVSRIFKPFAQADSSTTRKYGGTGLGLPITKNLIELMGGALSVESREGEGSTFRFAIRFDSVRIEEGTRSADEYLIATKRPVFRGEVLVCEDNEINQIVIREHLAKVGLESVIVPNGKAGVLEIRQRINEDRPFALIMMDIHMPVMDGLEAAKRLKEMGCLTPVVAMTANAMATDRENYLQNGMEDYIGKPFVAKELWSCLLRFLTPVEFMAIEDAPRPSRRKQEEDIEAVLDRTLGVARSAGDESLYLQLLWNFIKKGKGTITDIEESLLEDDLKEAHRKMHSLKSTSGTIGAIKLQKRVAELELLLKDDGAGVTKEQMKNLADLLQEVLDELKPETEELEMTTAEMSDKVGQRDDLNVRKLLDELEPLLESGNSQCLERMEEMQKILLPVGELGKRLLSDMEDYDFESAYERLKEIRIML